MKSIAKVLGAAALGLALVATTAEGQATKAPAQSTTPIVWNGGLGLSMPSTSGYNTGFNLRLGATFPLTGSPVWIRPEVGFDHFSVSCTNCGTLNLYSFGADAGYTFPTTGTKVHPYVLAGLQITNESWSVSAYSGSQTKLGMNLGGGITFPLATEEAYVEMRYVASGGSFDMIPLTFGLRF